MTVQSDHHPRASVTPPLCAGDRLSRVEFERRYAAMPHLKKAELIEGVVYMPSPVRVVQHGRPDGYVHVWLGSYAVATTGIEFAPNTTVRLDGDNEPQPDALLRVLPSHGGRTRTVDGYIHGGPELVAEISATSATYDLHQKRLVYQRHGVCEYVVWRTFDQAIDWFILRDGVFEGLAPDAAGVFRSEAFPGLWLDAQALLRGDMLRVLALLQDGLASTQHAAFAADLAARGSARER